MSAERTSLGISGRIAAAFQASRMTPLLALVAMPALAKPVLTVYTYDSFSADWGPGPAKMEARHSPHTTRRPHN
jgi:ABC-type thiamine transport system substrate-binding protein